MSNLYDFVPDEDAVAYNDLTLVDQYTLHLLSEFVSQVRLMSLLGFALLTCLLASIPWQSVSSFYCLSALGRT